MVLDRRLWLPLYMAIVVIFVTWATIYASHIPKDPKPPTSCSGNIAHRSVTCFR